MRQGTSCVFLYCPHVWLIEKLGAPVDSESERLAVEEAMQRVVFCMRMSAKGAASGPPASFRRGGSCNQDNKSKSSKSSVVLLIYDFQVLSCYHVLYQTIFTVVMVKRVKATGCRL